MCKKLDAELKRGGKYAASLVKHVRVGMGASRMEIPIECGLCEKWRVTVECVEAGRVTDSNVIRHLCEKESEKALKQLGLAQKRAWEKQCSPVRRAGAKVNKAGMSGFQRGEKAR